MKTTNKKVPKVISAHFQKMGLKSWEVRKKQMIERVKELKESGEMKTGNE